jgi:DHA1 family bicyclomycin/chloramphenicol resistance-like MFS transporter
LLSGSPPRRLPLLLGFLIAIGPVSVDMYLPAFPTIARQFHDDAAPQLTLAAYFIGLGIGQMMQGPLSDRVGRRLPILLGLALYTLASLGCAAAWSTASLSAFRVLAAFGGSAAVVIPRAMVRDVADGAAAATLFSRLTLVMGVAPIIAPILGSGVVLFASWRMIFLLAALYGIVAITLVWRFLPDTLPLARRSLIGFRSILIRYGEIALDRGFISHAFAGTFAMSAMFAYIGGSPGIFIKHYHWSPTGYAALFATNAAAYIGFSQINPLLVGRFGIRPIITIAILGLLGAAALLMSFAPAAAGAPSIMAGLFLCEFGFGLILPNTMVGALSRHQAHAGSASALMGTIQYCGGAVAGALVGLYADGTARPMALTMLVCAILAAIAAALRPAPEGRVGKGSLVLSFKKERFLGSASFLKKRSKKLS